MVEPTGTSVPANMAQLGHHDRQARPPRQGSSFGRVQACPLLCLTLHVQPDNFVKRNTCASDHCRLFTSVHSEA
ncbi:unnamed protein product [Schistosoma mattheei]|uniref:Uncharacterized protein n=1 Tax=Schistosoma mattheei TaxID=31246 RepID=A0A183Q2A3_9TREM|nr:unnamed protein product [Schistosoma mattheei]